MEYFEEKTGELSEEEIDALAPLAEEAAEEYEGFKEERVREVAAVREYLMQRKDRKFPLKVKVDDSTVVVFKVRRMTEKERSKYAKLNSLRYSTMDELTAEDMEEINQQSYEIMSELVVEPKMTVEEWKETVDTALLNHISTKIAMLSVEVNDAKIIAEFQK